MSDESVLFKIFSPPKNSSLTSYKCVKALNTIEASTVKEDIFKISDHRVKHHKKGLFQVRDSQ